MKFITFLGRRRAVGHAGPVNGKGVASETAWQGKALRNKARATVVAALGFHEKLESANKSEKKGVIRTARMNHAACDYYAYFLTVAELDSITSRFGLSADERQGVVELGKCLRGDRSYNQKLLLGFCQKMEGFKGRSQRYAGLLDLARGLGSASSRLTVGDYLARSGDTSNDWVVSPEHVTGSAKSSISSEGLMLRRPEMGKLKKSLMKINARRDWVASKCEDRLRAQYREAMSHAPRGKRLVVMSLASPSVKKYFPELDAAVMYEEVMRFLALNPKGVVLAHIDQERGLVDGMSIENGGDALTAGGDDKSATHGWDEFDAIFNEFTLGLNQVPTDI